ncbi:amidohydrolase family protein [Microlunatus aurantiacus]|uniref:Amidohydrolase family protein n=1 Tax=Microlunatus aurantiacus TaxID=446786 RepID=A0ABP7DAK7_9ACTN
MTGTSAPSAGTLVRRARLVEVGGVSVPSGAEPVDLLITGGRVSAVAPHLDPGDAFADGDGDVRVIDAAGRWAIPGLWDAHVHLRQWAQTRTRLDVGAARSAADVAALVRAHAATLPAPDTVIFGYGYRSAVWPEPPTVALLDAAAGDHPVILTSGDAHNGWLSSAAFRLLGVAPAEGALAENPWFALMPAVTELAGRLTDDAAAIARAVADAAAHGVVGITDFELAYGYRDWPERFARGVDQLRVRPAVYPDGLDAVIAAGLRTGDPLAGTGGLVTMGPLKIISDGSLNTRTAHCCQPYADAAPDDTQAAGLPNYDLAELVALLTRAHDHGLEVALHAIGDAAVATALTAFEQASARGGIEHAQLIRAADVPRLAALGLRASVQPAHLWDDRDVTAVCWPDRSDRCFPFRSLRDAGVDLALGSDAPVAPLDPWLALAAAVHRSADGREPWNAAESLSVGEALAASTDGQTTLALGGRGDLVLLDDDPCRQVGDSAAVARHLRSRTVAATLVAGRPTHLAL